MKTDNPAIVQSAAKELIQQGRAINKGIVERSKLNLKDAHELGKILNRLKDECDHGDYDGIREKIGVSKARDHAYRSIAKVPRGTFAGCESISEALEIIAATKPPEPKPGELFADEPLTLADFEQIKCRPCRVGKPKPNCPNCKIARKGALDRALAEREAAKPATPPETPPAPQTRTTATETASRPTAPAVVQQSLIPARLQAYFDYCDPIEEAANLLKRAADKLAIIENSPTFKIAHDGKAKITLYSNTVRLAGMRTRDIYPEMPCPDCGGAVEPSEDSDICERCGNRGFILHSEIEK